MTKIVITASDLRKVADCSFCGMPIEMGEAKAMCPLCRLPFHAQCWTDNYGCVTYGCEMVNSGAPATLINDGYSSTVTYVGRIDANDLPPVQVPNNVPRPTNNQASDDWGWIWGCLVWIVIGIIIAARNGVFNGWF